MYERIGGTYVVKKFDRWLQFKKHFRNLNIEEGEKTFLNTPRVITQNVIQKFDGEGTILSHSNVRINCNRDRCNTIFIGHGTGDKPYGGNRTGPKNLLNYDYIFVSGPKHLERLKDSKVQIPEKKLIPIGNMRFDAVVNKTIDKDAVFNRLGIKDRTRKMVLYAPTWRFGNGTFHKYVRRFCEEITPQYNLIVRPHYHDARHIWEVKLWAKSKGIKNLYFSNPSNLGTSDTMHDFAISDILLSDTSSVLYEYMVTANPIIVIDAQYDKLHEMPSKMNVMKHADIYNGEQNIVEMIEENLVTQKNRDVYREMLQNCFYYNDGKSTDRAIEFVQSLS